MEVNCTHPSPSVRIPCPGSLCQTKVKKVFSTRPPPLPTLETSFDVDYESFDDLASEKPTLLDTTVSTSTSTSTLEKKSSLDSDDNGHMVTDL